MNAKIKFNGNRAQVYMKLEDEAGNLLSDSTIEKIIIEGNDKFSLTVDEVEAAYKELKSRLYQGGAGMQEHDIYRMAILDAIANQEA